MIKSSFDKKYLYVTIIVLLGLIIFLFFRINSMSKAYSELALEYDYYKQEAVLHMKQLEGNIASLKTNLQNLNETYSKLSQAYNVLKKEVDSTIEKIEFYEQELQESMEWFKNNSILDKSEEQSRIRDYLKRTCLKKENDKCYIKLGCFYLINLNELGFEYKKDVKTTGEEDKLQSLSEFIENEGGDCEDYSLFYKAEYNYLLEQCGETSSSNIILDAWTTSLERGDMYWLDFDSVWYINYASGVTLKQTYIYPNVVCGNFYDLNTGEISGHCAIAFTKDKIESKQDIEELDGAPIIEPQNGGYMGVINYEPSNIYLLTKHNYNNPPESYIYEVITDNDLFLFSGEHEEWLSYSIFDQELHSKKEELLNLVK